MKLIQAILPIELCQEGPDNEICRFPDEHGGLELGTWYFEKKDDPLFHVFYRPNVGHGGRGVQHYHIFTKEEKMKVLENLMSFMETEGFKKAEEKEQKYFSETVLKLFAFNANPVWYFAG